MSPGRSGTGSGSDAFHGILDTIAEIPGVRISFDDGNVSDLEHGLPALVERRLTASFFVLAGRIGSPRQSRRGRRSRAAFATNMAVGTHGMEHRPWRGLAPDDRERELVEARARIEEIVERPVAEAAVPLGAYDRRLLRELRRLGYTAVHTSDGRGARAGAWLQPRFSIVAHDTAETVRAYTRSPPALRRAQLAAKGLVKRLR